MSSLATTASLITATMELSVVRMIRAAMATADIASGGPGHGAARGIDRFEPRQTVHPAPHFNSRPVIHPTPKIMPRMVIHPTVSQQQILNPPMEAQTPYNRLTSPIEPVWKKLPPITVPEPIPVIKVVHQPADIVHKGSLIDFFI